MILRNWLLLFILLLFSNVLFAFSPKREGLMIRNYSSKNVIINREFWEDPGTKLDSDNAWQQTVFDMPLIITDLLALFNSTIVRPNRELEIIRYYPLGPQLVEKHEKLEALPFMDKMRAIFKTLEINCNDGKKIITLDNLGEVVIKKWVGGEIWYFIEIFDYDLIGKPASEW